MPFVGDESIVAEKDPGIIEWICLDNQQIIAEMQDNKKREEKMKKIMDF